MKRFSTKRITALVLALIMTLSLLPMTAWAEGSVLTSTNNSGQAGVFLFTDLKGTTLSCAENVMCEQGKITIPCATDAPEYVYLATGLHDGLKIEGKLQEDPIGTWYNETDSFTCNVYRLEVPTSTTEYTVTRSWGNNGEQNASFKLVFDFSLKLYWSYNVQMDGWRNETLYTTPGGSNLLYLATDNTGKSLGEGTWTASVSSAGIGSVSMREDGLYWNHSDADTVKPGNTGTITISNGTTSYDISVEIGEPEIHVYTVKSGSTYSGELFADADYRYMYTSGELVNIYFVARENVKITGVDGTSYPDGVSEAIFVIPANDSGRKEFSVAFTETWQEGEGYRTENRSKEYRFFDTNDMSALFCRAVWDNWKDGWNNGRYYVSAGEKMTVEFALPPLDGSWPSNSDDAVMSLTGATVAVICSNNTAESPKNLGTVEISGNQVIWDCTAAIPGSTGVLKITQGETTYNVPVEITPAVIGVYSAMPDNSDLGKNYMTRDNNWHYTYTPSNDEDQYFYFLLTDWMTFAEGQTDISFVEGWNNKLAKYTIPADTYGNQRITIQLNEDPYSWEINFKEAERHNAIVGEDGLTADDKAYGPVPIGDTGYFIAPIGYLYGEIRALGGGWQSFHEDGQTESAIAVGFWKMGADGVTLELLEGEELAAVSARFNDTQGKTTLKMDIKLAGESNTENTEYPFDRKISPTNDVEYHKVFVSPNAYPLAKIYQFNKNSRGVWIYELTGTYTDGGKTFDVTAYGRDEKRTEKQDYVQIPAQSTPEATVAYINNFLQEYAGSSSEYNAIHVGISLPAGKLKGYIEVPAKNYNVFFDGAMDDDGNILTTLEGGIFAKNADTRATNVRFVGAGRGEKDWSKVENWNGSKLPNKAFYGEAGGGVYHCSFIGYDCAIEMNGGVIGAGGNSDYNGFPVGDTGSFFYNNEVAIKVNIPDGSDFMGDSQYWKMVMVNNGTDFDFEDVGDGSGYWVNINSAIFVRNDNKNSIHNTGGRTFFMPKCVFYNTANENTSGNNDPKVDGNVSIAPYYTLTPAGKTALITSLNVEEMLADPIYKEDWISTERLFPRSWICPANPDKNLYSVPADNITEEEMTIDIVDSNNDDEYVGTIKLKKNKNK